jgi:hypothetical protein
MAEDYLKLTTRIELADNAALNPVKIDETYDFTVRPDESLKTTINAQTGGSTLDLANFTTVRECVISNLDNQTTGNYVDVTFRNTANGVNDNIVRIEAGTTRSLGELTVANDLLLTANTAAVKCEVFVAGELAT